MNPNAISTGATFPFFYTGQDPRIPFGPITVAFVGGANPDIGPETAETWQVGADFEPIDNLRLSATYYNIAYDDRIASADVFGAFFNPLTYPTYLGYSDFIIPIDNPVTCVNGNEATYDPVLASYAGRTILYGGGIQNPCAVEVLLDARNTNLAATKQDGIDAQLGYNRAIRNGAVFFNLNVNKVLNNDQQVNPGDPFISRLGFYNSPVEWRGRGTVGLSYESLTVTLFGNYTGSYTNDQAVNSLGQATAPVTVDDYVTLDFNLSYNLGEDTWPTFVKGARASITIMNLTNKDPVRAFTANSVFNPAYSNPFGRRITFQITAGF